MTVTKAVFDDWLGILLSWKLDSKIFRGIFIFSYKFVDFIQNLDKLSGVTFLYHSLENFEVRETR